MDATFIDSQIYSHVKYLGLNQFIKKDKKILCQKKVYKYYAQVVKTYDRFEKILS
jgi:hypothetical protein